MMRKKRKLSFLLCLTPCLLLHATTKADPLKARCNGINYDSSSAFSANLATLFSFLTSLSSASNSATATAGSGADTAYGLYMCQGDLSGPDCQICVQTATADAKSICPNLRGGVLWYDSCELRYSDANFFGVADTDGFNFTNLKEETSSKKPVEVLSELVQAAPTRSPLMYAVNVSDVLPLYALAQCTANLSADGCRTCLTSSLEAIESCCSHRKGWRYLTPSCWIRYEPTPFFGNYPNAKSTYIIRSQCASEDFLSNSVGAQQQLNLRSLFADLKSQAPLTGFYNTSAGENSSKLYGLALCGGDATPGDCAACLGTAGSAIQDECLNKTEGYMWYGKCFLKYSNQNFFGQLDVDEHTFCEGGQIAEEIAQITATEARNLVSSAANSSSMFAAGRAAINRTASSYLLLQCTRDLSNKICGLCLDAGINKMMKSCKQGKGWQYLSGSCTIRFELFPFFNVSNTWQGTQEEGEKKTLRVKIIAAVAFIACLALLGLLSFCAWKLRRSKGSKQSNLNDFKTLQDRDLTFIDLLTIQVATDNFSDKNKLGEGGFGPVYKGVLQEGTEIAVKRLSQTSTQGLSEFQNEVKLIAQLQHKNLVRLLGCCVEEQEKLLIYEYLPNKSLDVYLSDPNKRAQLNWGRRFFLISGIAKGLLYLHEDSFLKVIHRDLKPSNILLDKEMNPKISDFGLSKIYVAEEIETDTHRVVGTHGYMAPEYAMDGFFSVKSDVFSFGVVLLEIISGENSGRAHVERHGQNLLGHAWDLWNNGKATELIDPLLEKKYSLAEATKCIHLGLLCVQKDAEERPTMSAVVIELRSDHIVLPQPSSPPKY